MVLFADIFGRKWDMPANELCFVCGQPDSCGDCNHQPLTEDEVIYLGGLIQPKIELKNEHNS